MNVFLKTGRGLTINTRAYNEYTDHTGDYIIGSVILKQYYMGDTAIHIATGGWSGMISLKFHGWSLREKR